MNSNTIGNTKLVEYGIQNEKSDLRAHVCVMAGRVYVYETRAGQDVLAKKSYRLVSAYTNGIVTATGYLVPPGDIPGCRAVVIPADWLNHSLLSIREGDTTSRKGDRAALIVYGLVKTNRFPLFAASAKLVEDTVLQINGVDVSVNLTIQVKCDFKGGPREFGGTGNLFLQTSECNPFKQFGETAKPPKSDAA